MANRKFLSSQSDTGRFLRCADLQLDLENRHVVKGNGQAQRLTPKECHLLATFIRNRGEVLTREFLMREVWETEYTGDTRTLEVHVHWLRRKIEDDPSNPRYIHTVRGVGYWFEPDQAALRGRRAGAE